MITRESRCNGSSQWVMMGARPHISIGYTESVSKLAIALLVSLSLASASAASASPIWSPSPGASWQWQITGEIPRGSELAPVEMYDIDLTVAIPERTVTRVPGFGRVVWPRGRNAGAISRLHEAGITVICYLDSGAWESYEPDASLFPRRVIGRTSGWSGERWLDIRRRARSRFAPIIWARFKLASQIGCDGVEPDQNNPIGNHPGFPITRKAERSWYLSVARHAHAVGLSVGMKNGVEVINQKTVRAFDWALNEECFYYHECGRVMPFINAGKAVFQTEYTDDWRHRGAARPAEVAARACSDSLSRDFSTLIKRKVPNGLYLPC